MNDVLTLLRKHRSFRKYKQGVTIPEEKLAAIIRAAQSAPSWINGQHYSIIAIKDQARKNKIAELCGNQAYIAECSVFLCFVADFYRVKLASEMHKKSFPISGEEDLLMVAATDIGLSMQNALTAAESLDYGTICIGGLRRNITATSEFLGLPEFVMPVVGLCIGVPDVEVPVKPRLPKEAVYFEETYQTDVRSLLEAYDKEIIPFSEREGFVSYTERLAKFYDKPYYPNLTEQIKERGFLGGK
ncbi:NADPH-dependent oxidoreductase [Listeria ivanovii]|uniref:NADPH-dependent oxidoreductase n=1 Tax=Listeria ivanovii TaxID=1638 RepID=UPI0016244258|nr:NADPH-dependent oxidoreductase [Listeria ivanovii]MBC2255857.1 NADPH-dependent oxidoreductase [Listeria ivanovii]